MCLLFQIFSFGATIVPIKRECKTVQWEGRLYMNRSNNVQLTTPTLTHNDMDPQWQWQWQWHGMDGRAHYLVLQEQGVYQGLNLGHDEELWRPPLHL